MEPRVKGGSAGRSNDDMQLLPVKWLALPECWIATLYCLLGVNRRLYGQRLQVFEQSARVRDDQEQTLGGLAHSARLMALCPYFGRCCKVKQAVKRSPRYTDRRFYLTVWLKIGAPADKTWTFSLHISISS